MCRDNHLCTISKDNGISKEKQICVPKKEYISGHKHIAIH